MIRENFIEKTSDSGIILNATAYKPSVPNEKYDTFTKIYKDELNSQIKSIKKLSKEDFANQKEDIVMCMEAMEDTINILLEEIGYFKKTTTSIKEERDAALSALLISKGYIQGERSI